MPKHLARWAHRLAFASALLAGAAQAADGLQIPAHPVWPVWQARVSLGMEVPADGRAAALRQAALLGDYYLQRPGDDVASAHWRGGFRATSGIVLGRLGGLPGLSSLGRSVSTSLFTVPGDAAGPEPEAWPYIGFGYSGLAPRGGWGFSADFGIALRQTTTVPELGRALLGLRGWESTLRQFEPLPMLQMGVHYRF